ncbi:MAG: hypothetical protein K5924_04015 [Chloroflexi bacterium]|nr:hypothetical protein [Chloroflexota bacterium]
MTQARITITGDSIGIEGLTFADAALAAFVRETPEPERGQLLERALRIGLLTLSNAGVSMSADVVKAEFERLYERMEGTQERAAETLAVTLREHFGDRDGRLPKTLEQFLGDDGKLRRLTHELFDETKRDSAIGRLNDLLGRYFDGDGSRLAQLLDPTRAGSPLHQFRGEVTDEFRRLSERITALEEAKKARAEERARGTAKGADFEEALEARLGAMARGMGDLVELTGTEGGDGMRSKKGDLVITIDPTRTRGTTLRIVVEAKDRSMPINRMTQELAEGRMNRSAAVALAVFTPHTAPTSVAPLAMIGPDVYATYDPETDDAVALEAAYRAARILALLTLRDAQVQLDTEAVTRSLEDLTRQVDCVRGLKTKLTHIGSTAREVADALDLLRAGVLRSVKDLEAQLAVVEDDASATSLTA